jgi:arsenite/tail-anchored protein-transporting ATPase
MTTGSPESTPRSKATSTPAADPVIPSASGVPRVRLVGGKGGVGKTTCAAAFAVAAAAAGHRTLIISTDPASSLGDALNFRLSATPRRIPRAPGVLHGVEINAARALDRWLSSRRGAFERMALRGTWLDQEDVSHLLRLSLPGTDELAGMVELMRFVQAPRYDRIIVDTAPTGHTLRMLTMPEGLRALARLFDAMQAKHRLVVEALRGDWTPDEDDALIDQMDQEGRDLQALLRDRSRLLVSWVTLPEAMATEETVDAAAALERDGIPLAEVIVNRVTPVPDRRCGWCAARRALEARAVLDLHNRLPSVGLLRVDDRIREPRGVRELASIGRELAERDPPLALHNIRAVRPWRRVSTAAKHVSVAPIAGHHTRLVVFGGKGGVGKTTCAAAAALALASTARQRRVLLLSADPAHSLADVLGTPLSDVPVAVPEGPRNLLVRELDAASRFQETRAKYAAAIDSLFDRLTRNRSGSMHVDAGQDRRVMHGLIELAPPGVDELAAVVDITDAIESHPADIVVMDTAPSGHALRLLEMPALVQDWTRALMSILLKYQPVVGLGELGAALLHLSQGLGRLRALLADADRTSFVVVTRAAALPRVETQRLMRRLLALEVHTPLVIVNAVGRGTCARCRAAASAETLEIDRLAIDTPQEVPMAIAPAELPPPRQVRALARWHRAWRPHSKPSRAAAISSRRSR